MSTTKQISRVLDAIQAMGMGTSLDVEAATGIQANKCSSYLSRLRSEGLVSVTGKVRRSDRGGALGNLWAAEKRQQSERSAA